MKHRVTSDKSSEKSWFSFGSIPKSYSNSNSPSDKTSNVSGEQQESYFPYPSVGDTGFLQMSFQLTNRLKYALIAFLIFIFRRRFISLFRKKQVKQEKQEEIEIQPEIKPDSIKSLQNSTIDPFLVSLLALNSWSLISKTSTISSYSRPTDSNPLPFIRGARSIINSNITLIEFYAASRFNRTNWDTRFLKSKILKGIDPFRFIIHTEQKGTWPVASRDFVVETNIEWDGDSCLFNYSKDSSLIQYQSPAGSVRGFLKISAWVFRLIDNETRLDYLVGVDINSTSIPTSLIASIQKQTPLSIDKLYDFVSEFGLSPFIVPAPVSSEFRIEGTFSNFIESNSNDLISIDFSCSTSFKFAIYIPRKWHNLSVLITCSIPGSCEATVINYPDPRLIGLVGSNCRSIVVITCKGVDVSERRGVAIDYEEEDDEVVGSTIPRNEKVVDGAFEKFRFTVERLNNGEPGAIVLEI